MQDSSIVEKKCIAAMRVLYFPEALARKPPQLTVETSVRYIPHGMFESPDHRIHDKLEFRRRQLQQS